eukprot:CAMPEP_0184496418 /NCGR_PEP_ID=MMETSP0113_2-20130426/33915_1 /TAXON_ID=91329 /ORGANISM="Norrisiella sphaerica, Strain BC52" /LENGTH=268 /DNA_ID=CAMNT_0026883029 /DNA_START=80 /DNA_END=886 /DNA_ORIENTATION=-
MNSERQDRKEMSSRKWSQESEMLIRRRNLPSYLLLASSALTALPSRAEDEAMSSENIPAPRKLDKIDYRSVPVFAVTDETGSSPYFTDETPSKEPAGFFFMERRDAERILKAVRKEDPKARITTVPFTEALNFVRTKTLNFGGEFHVLPSAREISNANNIRRIAKDSPFIKIEKKLQSKDAYDRIPLFYDEKLGSVIDGEPTVLAFLKYEDLQAVWEEQVSDVKGEVPDFSPKVLDFQDLVDKQTDTDTPNVLLISSENFEDVENLEY